VDTVKVDVVDKKSVEQVEGKAEESPQKSGGEKERQQPQQQKRQEQPKALTMAELLKDRESLKKKTKLWDGSNIKADR
jgi:hypothetical protein